VVPCCLRGWVLILIFTVCPAHDPKSFMHVMHQSGNECNWQCYLARYEDVRVAFGKDAQAKYHYNKWGRVQGRDCTCNSIADFLDLEHPMQYAGPLIKEGMWVKVKDTVADPRYAGKVGEVFLSVADRFFFMKDVDMTIFSARDLEVLPFKVGHSSQQIVLRNHSLFVALMSRRGNFHGRNVLRPALNAQLSKRNDVTLRFAICSRNGSDLIVRQEQKKFGDLLVLDCDEEYHKLTQKTLAAMRAYVQSYYKHSMFMKLDDDTYVQWHHLMMVLAKFGTPWSYVGGRGSNHVVRDDTSIWYEPTDSFKEDVYPSGMEGLGYILGRNLVRQILERPITDKLLLRNEDRAVAVWVREAVRHGARADYLGVPTHHGYTVPDFRERKRPTPDQDRTRFSSRPKYWHDFPFVMLHRLAQQNISCLLDASGKDDANLERCFSKPFDSSAQSTVLVTGYPRSGTTTMLHAMAAAFGYGQTPSSMLKNKGVRQYIAHNQNLPKLFSLFEPCHPWDDASGVGCTDLLPQLSMCNFSNLNLMMHWSTSHNLLGANISEYEGDEWPPALSQNFLKRLCDDSQVRLFKTITTNNLTAQVLPLLERDSALHVIDVVRDPRGIYASWKSLKAFGELYNRIPITQICSQLFENSEFVHPRLHRVVFDDLVLDARGRLTDLMKALSLRPNAAFEDWMLRNFDAPCERTNRYQTCRTNSSAISHQWMQLLNATELAMFANDFRCQYVADFYNFSLPRHSEAPKPTLRQASSDCRCAPGGADFPTCFDELDWHSFAKSLQGRLIQNSEIKLPQDVDAEAAMTDPHFLTHGGPGFTVWSGLANAWDRASVLPRAVVEAASVSDVQATVRFATQHRLRLAIKATGHDLHARSMAPGSLLLWTHKLDKISWRNDSFCGVDRKHVMVVGAGVEMWQLYTEAAAKKRMTAGGTCSTVGHTGFTMGGGYGRHANYIGSGAGNVLEAEIVLASPRGARESPRERRYGNDPSVHHQ